MAHSSGPVTSMTVLEAVKKLSARSRRVGDALQSAALELAAALIEAAGRRNSSPKLEQLIPNDADQTLKLWADCFADVVAAIAKGLSHGLRPADQIERSGENATLIAAAERLMQQTQSSSKVLGDLNQSLKASLEELLRQAGEVGKLSLQQQRERLRLADDLQKVDSLTAQMEILAAERGPVVERMRLLQERLQLAQASVAEQRRFENRVRDEQAAAKQAEASVMQLESELKTLQNKLETLKAEQKDLPRRIKQTEEMIRQHEESPSKEVFRGIQEIWKRLPLDQVDGASS